jgi:hypothetical protein
MAQSVDHPEQEVVQVKNLREFFRDSVDDAMESNRLAVDHHTSHYVVNLLTLFARAEAFHEVAADSDGPRPLALMLADALEAPTPEHRHLCLQRMGDVTLFFAGFFADDLQDAVVDLDYYVSMGGTAYSSLSVEARGTVRGRAFGGIFAELGAKFQQFVDVLNDVRNQAKASSDADLLRLYDVWQKTGSERARRLLREQGVYTFQPVLADRQH